MKFIVLFKMINTAADGYNYERVLHDRSGRSKIQTPP